MGRKLSDRLEQWLAGPYLKLKLCGVVLLLGLPALWIGFFIDDYAHRSIFLDVRELDTFPSSSPLLMFSFTDGVPENTRRIMDYGILPWWTSDTILASFWRPFTALTHWVDYLLWPNTPFLMHLHSLLWFAGLIVLLSLLYKQIDGAAWIAGLAVLLYAFDEAHAFPMGWLANRNATLAAFWGILCLLAHHRWRRDGSPKAMIVALIALALSVHSNEGGIAVTGYLFSYALFIDRANVRSRILSLVPYTVVILAWRAYYVALGFGVRGSPLYTDPGVYPLRFAADMLVRTPVLLAGQWFNMPTEALQLVPPAARPVVAFVAAGLLVILFRIFIPVLRRSKEARFWFLGMLLATVPACATEPSNRTLLFVGVGAMGLLARYFAMMRSRELKSGRFGRFVCGLMVVLHAVVAPILLSGTLVGLVFVGRAVNKSMDSAVFPPDIAAKTAVLVDSPTIFLTAYMPVKRSIDGKPVPAHMYTLSPNSLLPVPIRITRTGPRTLRFAPKGGYPVLLFRMPDEHFAVGDLVELEAMTVEVREVDPKGKPLEVDYRFQVPLEDPSLYWLQMDGFSYIPFTPPPMGETVVLNPSGDDVIAY